MIFQTRSQGRRAKPLVGLARALSKLGFCSRSQAWTLIEAGRVRVNGVVCREPECRVNLERDRLEVEGRAVQKAAKVYLMLNKPRGLVTTASDEHGRATVFECLAGKELPFVAPIGRLDKASEGLLLFTNDTQWAARIAAPETHLDKTYHVQVDCVADEELARRVQQGVQADGELLCARRVIVLRCGEKNSWLEVVLDEGSSGAGGGGLRRERADGAAGGSTGGVGRNVGGTRRMVDNAGAVRRAAAGRSRGSQCRPAQGT